jgi:hypothetical protein
MQAEVIAENTATLRWVQAKLGYRPVGKPYYAMGIRDQHGKRLRIQAIIRELDDWEIGAWKREEPLTALPSRARAAG